MNTDSELNKSGEIDSNYEEDSMERIVSGLVVGGIGAYLLEYSSGAENIGLILLVVGIAILLINAVE